MSKLHYIHHTALATGRGGIGPLQRMWPLPQASWHTSAYIPQNGRNQESQPREDGRSRTKAKSKQIWKCAKGLLISAIKSLFDSNGLPASQSEGTPPPNYASNQRLSHNSGSDRSNSPVSRNETPAHPSNIAPQHMFDGVSSAEHAFQSPAIPAFQLRHPSPGSTSSFNDRNLEPPQTYEGLLQANTFLKTRVSELEVINDLYKGTVNQYEQGGAPQAEMIPRDSESQLRQSLDQALRREEDLKHQLDELEREVAELRGEQSPAKKRRRISDSEYPEPPQAFTNGLHA